MKGRKITEETIIQFQKQMTEEEKSNATKEKYVRDIRAFIAFSGKRELNKETTIAYKKKLLDEGYAVRSVNSMLASLNSLFAFLSWHELRVKALKIQQDIFCPEEKELTKAEYERLCRAAERKHRERLLLIIQTICGTGIRVSELQFITVEAVKKGEATVSLKGKTRTVFIVRDLQRKLLDYIKNRGLRTGTVFLSGKGKPISRTVVWREMKGLCTEACVDARKVFPHNLRHLFARVFYGIEKDIAKLADILGHSSINTTRIYIISTGVEHRKRMERMRLIIS